MFVSKFYQLKFVYEMLISSTFCLEYKKDMEISNCVVLNFVSVIPTKMNIALQLCRQRGHRNYMRFAEDYLE